MSQMNKWSTTNYLGFLLSETTWFNAYIAWIFNLEITKNILIILFSYNSSLASDFLLTYPVPFYASEFQKNVSNWLPSRYPWCFPCADHWSLPLSNSGYAFSISVLTLRCPFSADWLEQPCLCPFFIQWNKDLTGSHLLFWLAARLNYLEPWQPYFFRNSKRGLKLPYKDQRWGMLSCKKDFIQSCQVINALEKPSTLCSTDNALLKKWVSVF